MHHLVTGPPGGLGEPEVAWGILPLPLVSPSPALLLPLPLPLQFPELKQRKPHLGPEKRKPDDLGKTSSLLPFVKQEGRGGSVLHMISLDKRERVRIHTKIR